MTKKNFIKMSVRSVKGSLSRFLAIVSIVALGTGFLAGLLATTPDMKDSANEYFEESNLYDFYIQSTLGFSDENVKAVGDLSYVSDVMAIEQEDIMVSDSEGENLETRIFHIDFNDKDRLNKFTLLEGDIPKNDNECIIEVPNRYSYEAKIGDVFTTSDGREYKATGIAYSPVLMSTMGEITTIGKGSVALGIYVQEDDSDVTYTALYGKIRDIDNDTFSDEYKDRSEEILDKLETVGKEQSNIRYKELKDEAQEELNKSRAEYEQEKAEALAELEDSRKMLVENQQKVTDGISQIDDGLSQVNSGISQIDEGLPQIDDGIKQIDDGIVQINDGISQAESGLTQLSAEKSKTEESIAAIKEAEKNLETQIAITTDETLKAQLEAQLKELQTTRGQAESGLKLIEENEAKVSGQLNSLKQQLSDLNKQKSDLKAQKVQLQDQRVELQKTKQELTAQRAELVGNLNDIEEGWAEYRDGLATANESFASAEKQLDDAQKEIDEIETGKWYISGRLDAQGISSYESDTDKVAAIARIFPVFFFLVAALVVLTTMTRMIEEERGRVGTLKSLGYTNGVIRNYYLVYGFVASLIGSAVGMSVGFVVFPKVLAGAYAMMYNVPPVTTRFIWPMAIVIAAVTIGVILLTIYFSCRGELKEKPASLLQPKAPEAGKRILMERITPIWSRLKFTRKVTLRNLFRYKKRFLMTIIGMTGCFALLLTGFGIRDSINDIVGIQYGEIFKYDMTISVDKDKWKPSKDIYEKQGFFAEENAEVAFNGDKETFTLTVPESQKALSDFIDIRTRTGHEALELKSGEVVLSEKMCEVLDVKTGDTVTVTLDSGEEKEMKVSGICENYVGSVGFVNADTYEDAFGKAPDYSTLYVDIKDKVEESEDTDSLVRDVMNEPDVEYVLATDTISQNFNDSVKNIDYIVMVLIISAGGLSIIVLYNLTNVNVSERKKELATIKVLGFYEREVSSYIFREINILAVLGMICGLPLGLALHRFVIKTAEVGGMMFGRNIYLLSYILSFVIMGIFTFLVNLIMRRSIRKIDMVESMKAND